MFNVINLIKIFCYASHELKIIAFFSGKKNIKRSGDKV